MTRISSTYGKGKFTIDGKELNLEQLSEIIAKSRDPNKLQQAWEGWHTISPPMKADYARMVEIGTAGAKELGFSDIADMWLANYDMPSTEMEATVEELWGQVQPLYNDLHCYVRGKLNAKYGDAVQPKTGPIRADLLGNMWAQDWGNIVDIAGPPSSNPGYDLNKVLVAKNYDPIKMVKTGEAFYTSLGLPALPASFWERSMFTKPRDREVVCHASAWDIDNLHDLRIKMCIKVNSEDFVVIHHELGHNYYQRAYNQQPFLYLNGAHDGFHEAIGDFIALSITPEYLVQIGLLDPAKVPSADKDIGLLLRQAMDKVAFLPFGLLMDKWRWGVFSGETKPEAYQTEWNALRLRYQGIVPPVERPATVFDPGAKYHIQGNTPYARYFLASILQFQFYKAAAEQVEWKGPLHRCSFYGNKAVGERLNKMLAMGASKPWPDALEAFTGSRKMDGSAMIAYFQPLMKWLEEQNKDRKCGW
jgi:peptidyl-dipeptidase A